jgi:NADH dehydrogenase
MKHQNIVVFGGSGFVGGHLVARLVTSGARVTVVARRREAAQRLIMLPTVNVIEADPYDLAAIEPLLAGQDAAVNLIGVLHSDVGQPYGRAFARAHVEFPRTLVAACQRTGVARLLHVSALGAASDAPSMYLRSKADGESSVLRQHRIDATVFRPSVIFGPDDRFLQFFARLQRLAPLVPLACAHARFAPVYVGDVADAMIRALDQRASIGKTYELAGSRIYTLAELVRLAGSASGHPRPIVPLPAALGRLQAWVAEIMPGPTVLSRDNLDSMKRDCVASGRLPGLDAPELQGGANWKPTPLDPVALEELAEIHGRSRLDLIRERAHR